MKRKNFPLQIFLVLEIEVNPRFCGSFSILILFIATGQWPECEYSSATRFSMLMEHYQNVVQQEKQEKQDLWRRKAPKQHKYPSLTV